MHTSIRQKYFIKLLLYIFIIYIINMPSDFDAFFTFVQNLFAFFKINL